MTLIAIVGRAGSGKDTVADILVRNHGWAKIALADPLKRAAQDFFGFTNEQLWGPSAMRNAPDMRFPREHTSTPAGHCDCCGADLYVHEDRPCYLTPRHALQQLGTEFGRRCYPDVWVDYALRVADRLLNGPEHECNYYSAMQGVIFAGSHSRPKGVCISDARFPNEVAAVRAKGGRIWKTVHGAGLAGPAGAHESESYIDSLAVDAAVPDSGLDALPGIIANMLQGKG